MGPAITSDDFSVVIQGPIMGKPGEDYGQQKTLQCLESIKRVLPGAEIILSTWKGSDCSHLFYHQVVFNDDPGAVSYNDEELKSVFNNNNRQIVSTSSGLKAATRKYAIKMRADFIMESDAFLALLHQFNAVNKYRFFRHRILVPTYVSRDPEKIPLLYHISDLFQVGYADDLRDLWDIPLQPEPGTTRAFPYTTFIPNNPFRDNQYRMRYASEQYIWYAFARKKGLDLSLQYFTQIPPRIVAASLLSIIDNFVIAGPEQLGIILPESIIAKFNTRFFYTHAKWTQLYEALCVRKSGYAVNKHTLLIHLCSQMAILSNIKYRLKQRVKQVLKHKG